MKILEKKTLKSTNGITLIALVITIIVLLILAGISISMLSGDNGILQKATTAKTNTDNAQIKERVQLAYTAALSDGKGELKEPNLRNELTKEFGDNYDLSEDSTTNEWVISINEIERLRVSKGTTTKGGGDTIQAGETAIGGNKNYESDEKTAIIPENFTVSSTDSSINTGLVVTGPDGSEFVWIPIDKDSLKPIAGNGSLVDKPIAEKIGSDWRGILYDFYTTGYPRYSYSDDTARNSGYREPAFYTGMEDNPGYISSFNLDGKIPSLNDLQTEYNAIINSIKENGGFYVGRYESSIDGNSIASKKSPTPTGENAIMPMSAETDSGNMWYGLYEKQKAYQNKTDIKGKVKSAMITGACYDAILNWALNSGNDSSHVIANNNGNHNGSVVGCGTSVDDVINNIYDLEGNMYEWTSEASGNPTRVLRGGYCMVNLSPEIRSDRNFYPYNTDAYYGSRMILYL